MPSTVREIIGFNVDYSSFCWLIDTASSALRRIGSGIQSLDAVTSGGIPESTVTMVYGPPKAGKSVFAYHFIAESIRVSEACVIVTTDYGADELARAMSGFNWFIQDALKHGGIQVISMMPVSAALSTKDTSLKIVSLADPTDLMMTLNEVLRSMAGQNLRFRAIWDSLTPLFIYNPPMLVAKILREYSSKMKKAGTAGVLVTLDQGSIDPQSETIIKASVDNLVNLHPEGKLVVEGMLGTPRMTVAYSITNTDKDRYLRVILLQSRLETPVPGLLPQLTFVLLVSFPHLSSISLWAS